MSSRRVDVYATLLADITSWQASPGSPLREEELAARLGVSRTPVREAIARLRLDGLVEQRPGQIARVTAVGVDGAVAVYQARDALESYAVQLAAASSQRSLFAPLAASYRELAETAQPDAASMEQIYALTDDFDETLLTAVPNPYLLGPLRSTRAALLRLRRLAALSPERLSAAAGQRAEVCRAVADGDAATAGRVSHERIQASLAHVVSALLDGRQTRVVPAIQG